MKSKLETGWANNITSNTGIFNELGKKSSSKSHYKKLNERSMTRIKTVKMVDSYKSYLKSAVTGEYVRGSPQHAKSPSISIGRVQEIGITLEPLTQVEKMMGQSANHTVRREIETLRQVELSPMRHVDHSPVDHSDDLPPENVSDILPYVNQPGHVSPTHFKPIDGQTMSHEDTTIPRTMESDPQVGTPYEQEIMPKSGLVMNPSNINIVTYEGAENPNTYLGTKPKK